MIALLLRDVTRRPWRSALVVQQGEAPTPFASFGAALPVARTLRIVPASAFRST